MGTACFQHLYKKLEPFNYKPTIGPQGESLNPLKSVVTSCLQTFPPIATWSRFHPQILKEASQVTGAISFWAERALASKSWFDFKAWQKAAWEHRTVIEKRTEKLYLSNSIPCTGTLLPRLPARARRQGQRAFVQTISNFLLSWQHLVRASNWWVDDRRDPAHEPCQTSDNNV